jgi:hypothetical protein
VPPHGDGSSSCVNWWTDRSDGDAAQSADKNPAL